MTPEQKRKASELYLQRYEATHPRKPGESAFAFYAGAIGWLGTPEGMTAFRESAEEALRG